jgi:DNA repair protein RecO (recombination protein O)
MEWHDAGIILANRRHGENAAILSLLTPTRGRHRGLDRRGAAGRGGGLLQPGTAVAAVWRGRIADNLGTFRCEVVTPVAPAILENRRRLDALAAACAVLESALPEREVHECVYRGLTELLALLGGEGPDWAEAYVRWEVMLLAELGYGLDFSRCALSGAREGLAYVSPRTGRAVTAAAAEPYRDKLLPLPAFLVEPRGAAGARAAAIDEGLSLTGRFLARDVFGAHARPLPAARRRLAAHFAGEARRSPDSVAPAAAAEG